MPDGCRDDPGSNIQTENCQNLGSKQSVKPAAVVQIQPGILKSSLDGITIFS
jgi:hypothetical protein